MLKINSYDLMIGMISKIFIRKLLYISYFYYILKLLKEFYHTFD